MDAIENKMKFTSFDDFHKLLESFIKTENLCRLVKGLDGEEEVRGLTSEDISRFLRGIGVDDTANSFCACPPHEKVAEVLGICIVCNKPVKEESNCKHVRGDIVMKDDKMYSECKLCGELY